METKLNLSLIKQLFWVLQTFNSLVFVKLILRIGDRCRSSTTELHQSKDNVPLRPHTHTSMQENHKSVEKYFQMLPKKKWMKIKKPLSCAMTTHCTLVFTKNASFVLCMRRTIIYMINKLFKCFGSPDFLEIGFFSVMLLCCKFIVFLLRSRSS